MVLKVGREYLDPLNRVVTLIRGEVDGMVVVRLAGPYGATIFYPTTCLRSVP